jgi:hypothetical protein
MEAEKNSVVYMGLFPGPNKADNICGKTKVMGMTQRGFTVHTYTYTFTDPISTQVELDMDFVKNRIDCHMQSSQNTDRQMRHKATQN